MYEVKLCYYTFLPLDTILQNDILISGRRMEIFHGNSKMQGELQ